MKWTARTLVAISWCRTRRHTRRAVWSLLVVLALGTGGVALAIEVPAPGQPPDQHGMQTRLAACAFCHGKLGDGGLGHNGDVYPRLAGQPAGYLYREMQRFVGGERAGIPPVVVMRQLLESLSPAYMARIARFYQDAAPAYPTLAPAARTVLEQGRELVEQGVPKQQVPPCAECHGAALQGRLPDTPALAGQYDRYLTVQLAHWAQGQRHDPLHQRLARALTSQQVQAIAAYLSSLRPASTSTAK